jgi:hypothetical protein
MLRSNFVEKELLTMASSNPEGDCMEDTWEQSFRKSRWFTRGWTLQELLAPKDFMFYASNGDRLGDKSSLEALISEVTGIPKDAIHGSYLTDFSFEEKMSWMEKRSTKKEEDAVYSMLGIFGVLRPVVYGEGRYKALRGLRREVDETTIGQMSIRITGGLALLSEHLLALTSNWRPSAGLSEFATEH